MRIMLLTISLLVSVACTVERPRAPMACQINLRDCQAAYAESQQSFCSVSVANCSRERWDFLCRQDFSMCETGFGQ
jgi:hypothetical protein